MKKYNKHYCKRDPELLKVIVEDDAPVLGEISKSDIPLDDSTVRILNANWEESGIYYAEAKGKQTPPQPPIIKTPERIELEKEATELGIKFRDNIGSEKLQEKINEKKGV